MNYGSNKKSFVRKLTAEYVNELRRAIKISTCGKTIRYAQVILASNVAFSSTF
jgi:hypothetical protein